MINPDLQNFHHQLEQAICSEDVFGMPAIGYDKQNTTDMIKKAYHDLAQKVHPDKFTDQESKDLATDTFNMLNDYHTRAVKKLEAGKYGSRQVESAQSASGEFEITTNKRKYIIEKTLCQGDISTIYLGRAEGVNEDWAKVVIKVTEDVADNDLSQNELRVVKMFNAEPSTYSKHLPVHIDDFRTHISQMGIILKWMDAYDLNVVRDKYPHGIPPRHIIWIFRRVLSVLGYAHSKGVIHGNIEPSHILLRPSDHNVYLIDWSYAIVNPGATGQGFRAFNEKYSPPEVKEKKPPIPGSDLYSVALCMLYLLGGNIETKELPASIDERIVRFIKVFLKESPIQRPQDAWEMYAKLDDLRQNVYGAHEFIEFPWPA